jgi:peptidoglycan/xylan/chitin deacetylase (PgdA/CDA1 family)
MKWLGRAANHAKWPLLFLFVWMAVSAAVPDLASGEEGRSRTGDQAIFERLSAGELVLQVKDYAPPAKPTVYLTFDDGPSAHTPEVLDILREEGVPATFFVLGKEAERRPDTVRRILEEGHSIGNHTYDHDYRKLYAHGFGEFWGQVQQTSETIKKIAGVETRLLRAPGGTYTNFDASYFYYLDQAGYSVYDWNVDSGDSSRKNVPAKEIIRGATRLPGGKADGRPIVVLLHDGHGHAETVKALPDIIRFYKENGYEFARMTPDVKPMMSPLGKLKWDRTETFEQFIVFSELVRNSPFAFPTEIEAYAGDSRHVLPAAQDGEGMKRERKPAATLTLLAGKRSLELGPEQYFYRGETLYVPVRAFIERIGGTVGWDGDTRRASVQYGTHRAVYDLKQRTIEIYAFGRLVRNIPLAAMVLKNDTLMAPLANIAGVLGASMGALAIAPDLSDPNLPEPNQTRIVRVHVRGQYGIAFPHMLAADAFRHLQSRPVLVKNAAESLNL